MSKYKILYVVEVNEFYNLAYDEWQVMEDTPKSLILPDGTPVVSVKNLNKIIGRRSYTLDKSDVQKLAKRIINRGISERHKLIEKLNNERELLKVCFKKVTELPE